MTKFVRHHLLMIGALATIPTPIAAVQSGVATSDLATEREQGAALRDEGLKRSQVATITTDLADRTGSRLSGSPALALGYRWAIDRLRRVGAENVHLEDCGEFGIGWRQTHAWMEMSAPSNLSFVIQAVPWSVGSAGQVTANAVAAAIDSPADFARYQGRLRGKVVFLGQVPLPVTPFMPAATRYTEDEVLSGRALDEVHRYYAKRPYRLPQLAAQVRFRRALGRFLIDQGARAIVLSSMGSSPASAGILETDDAGVPGGRAGDRTNACRSR